MAMYNLDAELGAIQFVLGVLIASHPDKKELLAKFDIISSEHQIAALALGGSGISEDFRNSLVKYRDQIKENP